jgi:acetyl esterase
MKFGYTIFVLAVCLSRGTKYMLITDETVRVYADALKAAGQTVKYVQVEGTNHVFLDWKPDAQTRAAFEKYGVPYAPDMKAFFDSIFYPKKIKSERKGQA